MFENIKNDFQNFINESTIHGVHFIVGEKRSIRTRIFWSISFILSILLFAYYIFNIYIKWLIDPDIAVRSNIKFLSQIPFPAITLCSPLFARDDLANYAKFLKGRKENLTDLVENEVNYFASGIQACSPLSTFQWERYMRKYRTEKNIIEHLNKSFLNTNEALNSCSYISYNAPCNKMLNRVLTSRGFCYTFNMQGFNTIFNADVISDDFKSYKRTDIRQSPNYYNALHNITLKDDSEIIKWSLDNGFSKNHDKDEIPVAAQRGSQFSAYMILNEKDSENLCLRYGKAFNYYIHLPNDIPSPLHKQEYVRFGETKAMTLTAKSYRADEGLRSISSTVRGCYFDGERKLKFFKSYTKSNCDYECMTNYTLKTCNCVGFGMPRDNKTPVCDWEKGKCYAEAMKKWPDFNSTNGDPICGCLRTCSYVKYSVDFEEVREVTNQVMKLRKFNENDSVSRISFLFSDPLIEEEEMYAPYKLQSFIADTGGLLGLFMGCSLLSLIEIFYFSCSMFVFVIFALLKKATKTPKIIQVQPMNKELNLFNVNSDTEQLYFEEIRRLRHEMTQRHNELKDMIKKRDDNLMIILEQIIKRLPATNSHHESSNFENIHRLLRRN